MRNRVFEIVVFLIDYMQGENAHPDDTEEVWATLEARGYSDEEITSAYSWLLRRVEAAPRRLYSDFPKRRTAGRILTDEERSQLSPEAQGMLVQLLDSSIIDSEQLETILERTSVLWPKPVTLDQARLVAASVVFAELDEIDALTLFDDQGDLTGFTN